MADIWYSGKILGTLKIKQTHFKTKKIILYKALLKKLDKPLLLSNADLILIMQTAFDFVWTNHYSIHDLKYLAELITLTKKDNLGTTKIISNTIPKKYINQAFLEVGADCL